MRWAGTGPELWRVRVDLFAERRGTARDQITAIAERLKARLTESDGDAATDRGFFGVDQGSGGAGGRNVIGMTFWIRANGIGEAAVNAVELARIVGAGEGAGPGLYDVTVVPRDAVTFPDDDRYPPRPT